MSCCRDNPSEDVLLYSKVAEITRALEGKQQDWNHPVKGRKLKALLAVLNKLEAEYVRGSHP